jgi:hypothetical protein
MLLDDFKVQLQESKGIVDQQLRVMISIVCCFEALAV